MMIDVTGLRVVVTAGAGGAGLGIARCFADGGAQVAVCDVDQAAMAEARTAHPNWLVIDADVGEVESVDRLFDQVFARFGGVDVLINNAGIAGPTADPEDVDPADWTARWRSICAAPSCAPAASSDR